MTNLDGLWQVYTDLGQPICAGLVVENGRVVHCAPILRKWCLGRSMYDVSSWQPAWGCGRW